VKTKIDNKLFNFEFALKTGKVINLSRKDFNLLEKTKEAESKYEYKILSEKEDDFSFKSVSKLTEALREPIGSVLRGGYSQLRGKGIGLCLVETEKLRSLYEEQ
jgi:glycine cleavage system aminomethyltransferase T